MPDITMCMNASCPMRDRCYRYRAVPDEVWQYWAMFYLPDFGSLKCDMFWPIERGRVIRSMADIKKQEDQWRKENEERAKAKNKPANS